MQQVSFTPFPLLTTQRLLLRQMIDADGEQVFKLKCDKTTLEFLDKAPMESLAEAILQINKINEDAASNTGITWGIALNEKPEIMIGSIGFWRIIKDHYRAEIGYMLLPEYFRKGYMNEAIKTVIQYGFKKMNLHSIEANINPGNIASEILLENNGFIKEAYHRENFYYNGRFLDSAIYSLINKVSKV